MKDRRCSKVKKWASAKAASWNVTLATLKMRKLVRASAKMKKKGSGSGKRPKSLTKNLLVKELLVSSSRNTCMGNGSGGRGRRRWRRSPVLLQCIVVDIDFQKQEVQLRHDDQTKNHNINAASVRNRSRWLGLARWIDQHNAQIGIHISQLGSKKPDIWRGTKSYVLQPQRHLMKFLFQYDTIFLSALQLDQFHPRRLGFSCYPDCLYWLGHVSQQSLQDVLHTSSHPSRRNNLDEDGNNEAVMMSLQAPRTMIDCCNFNCSHIVALWICTGRKYILLPSRKDLSCPYCDIQREYRPLEAHRGVQASMRNNGKQWCHSLKAIFVVFRRNPIWLVLYSPWDSHPHMVNDEKIVRWWLGHSSA